MFNKKGQTVVEAGAIIAIVISALVLMVGFIRSSIMGGWFTSVQQLGDPYDPAQTTGVVTHSTTINTNTHVNSIATADSLYSLRMDHGHSFEGKSGTLKVKAQ